MNFLDIREFLSLLVISVASVKFVGVVYQVVHEGPPDRCNFFMLQKGRLF